MEEVQLQHTATPALEGVSANATPRPLYPRERPGNHFTGVPGGGGLRGRSERALKISPPLGSIRGPSSPYRLVTQTKQSCSPHYMYRSSNMIWMIKCGMHDGGLGEVHTGVRCKNMKGRDYLGNLGVDGNNIKMDLRERG